MKVKGRGLGRVAWTVLLAGVTVMGGSAAGGEWPQILGPHRNGVAASDERLEESWPAGGPPVIWQRSVGRGLAGVAVAGGTCVLFHRVGDEEIVEAMDAASGRVRWRRGFPTSYTSVFVDDDGPRCTPVISGQRVIVYGAQGGLRCLNLRDGEVLWEVETHRVFDAPEGYFGAGSTPLVWNGRVIVNVGGARKGAGVVAFDLKTGRTLWTAVEDAASYSSPVVATLGGQPRVVCVTRLNCVGLDPRNGTVAFSFPFGRRGPTVNAATPLVLGDRLFVSAHYGVGAVWAKLSADDVRILWRSDEIMSNHYMTCIEYQGKLFGIHGQERLTPGELRCIDPRQQRVLWSVPDFGYGAAIRARDRAVFLKTDGELVLWAPDMRRFRPLTRVTLFDSTTRALPALAGGRLYARDRRTLKCVRVGRSGDTAR
ncbi:MAG: hypothetical protein D6725_12065 [Planctomycetota bacterium]|nr:MAG: hypothetical protein D6725_12065 [Planctomycetota bacterium]